MQGLGNYRLALVILTAACLFAVSSMIDTRSGHTGGLTQKHDFQDGIVYIYPDSKCRSAQQSCGEAIGFYGGRIEELENEIRNLNEKIISFLGGQCEAGKGAVSIENAVSSYEPGSVRNFAVFISSGTNRDTATSIYEYVRNNIRFVKDPEKEYIATPCETILTGGGDCEDHAILLASLLESVGMDSVIISIPGEHVLAGIVTDEDPQGLCEKFLQFTYRGKRAIPLDTTYSNCMGGVSEKYVNFGSEGWEWKKKPAIIDA